MFSAKQDPRSVNVVSCDMENGKDGAEMRVLKLSISIVKLLVE
jgi:hypothetical protein